MSFQSGIRRVARAPSHYVTMTSQNTLADTGLTIKLRQKISRRRRKTIRRDWKRW